MSLNCGIIGLPNVGKSTIFSALSSAEAESANYPFCTIDPNFGLVSLPDPRLDRIVEHIPTQKVVPTTVEFVDIAGLVKGASSGEGLGNKFLSHIRETNILISVVRCFEDKDIVHVHNKIDPVSDIESINIELALADLETLEKRQGRLEKELRNASKHERSKLEKLSKILAKLHTRLSAGGAVRSSALDTEDLELIRDIQLITSKPLLYLCNLDEDGLQNGSPHLDAVRKQAEQEAAPVVALCGKLEKDIAGLDSEEERQEFLAEAGLAESGLGRLIREAYALLGLQTYFTAGEKEVRAWTFRAGMTASQCAGIIHSDFERGFIKAEVYHCEDLFALHSEAAIRKAGKLRIEGKDYLVQDGDVVFFRFNV